MVHGDPAILTGNEGASGVGVSSITKYYLATSSGSGVTVNTSGWTSSPQTMTSTNKYLWIYEKTIYTDGQESVYGPYISGVYGQQGPPGGPGDQGDTGTSVDTVTTYYAKRTKAQGAPTKPSDGTGTPGAPPSPWQSTEPTYVAGTTDVVYTTIRTTFTNPSKYTYSAVSVSTTFEAAKASYTASLEKIDAIPAVYHAVSSPSSLGPLSNVVEGSTYFRHENLGNGVMGGILGQWVAVTRAGNVYWDPSPIKSEVIANLDVGKITAGVASIIQAEVWELWANEIRARKITTDMLSVGPGLNIQEDPTFQKTEVWPEYRTNTGGTHGGGAINFGNTSLARSVFSTKSFIVDRGGILRVRVSRACSTLISGRGGIQIQFRNDSGSLISTVKWLDNGTALTEWLNAFINIPINAATGTIGFFKDGSFTSTIRFSNLSVTHATDPSLIVDGGIEARHLNIVNMDSTGGVSIQPDGIRAYLAGNTADPLIEITTSGENAISVGDASGNRATMSPTGSVSARELNSPSILYGGQELSDYWNSGTDVVAYIRDPIPYAGPVGDSIARVMSARFIAKPRHAYRVEFSGINYRTKAGDRAGLFIGANKGTNVNDKPTVVFDSSTDVLTSWLSPNSQNSGMTYSSSPIYYVWRPNMETTERHVVVIVGIRNWNSGGTSETYYGSFHNNFDLQRDPSLAIVDLGPNELVGGVAHGETTPASTPPPSWSFYTDTFYATSFGTYNASGVKVNTWVDGTYPTQGYPPGDPSFIRRAIICFNGASIRSRLSGATITGVRLRLTSQYFAETGGGILRLATHNHSTPPTSGLSFSSDTRHSITWGRSETKWVDIHSLWPTFGDYLKSNSRQGVGLEGNSYDSIQYGYIMPPGNTATSPALEISYKRLE